ncbi:MAG TPA: sulfotransferase [Gaiellales bacterium]|nr:sulfotransferase [Gaiellales bacterium]
MTTDNEGAGPRRRGPARAPIFLVGSERSGSTLLRLMLDHHPRIAFAPEIDFVVEHVSDTGEFPAMPGYLDWIATVRGADYAVDPRLDYLSLVHDFLDQKQAAGGGKEHVGATVHRCFERLRFLWPDARYIHLLRDPRDVARSVVQKGWAGNLYQAAEFWIAAERSWDALRPHLEPGRSIEVRYEELVGAPERELARLCGFIGVDYSEAMLAYPQDARQYPPPDPSLARQWRTKLTPRETALVEARTSLLMAERGYPASVRPPLRVGQLEHHALLGRARLRRLHTRVGHYGPLLVAEDVFGRRLGLRSLARAAQHRINAIDQRLIDEEAAGRRAPSANIAPALPPDG